jgi:hypothetical protein
MDIDQFWQLIDHARAAAGPQADQAVRDLDDPDDAGEEDRDYWDFDEEELQALVDAARAEFGADDLADAEGTGDEEYDGDADDLTDPVAVALFELLVQRPAGEIADFDNTFEDVRAMAATPGLVAAATLIEHGLMGDDSFDDFRAGLVALGRRTFEAALADPDSLADHSIVREIAAAADPRWLGREDVLFVASHAYAEVTGEDAVTFFDFAESLRDPDSLVEPPAGPEWDVEDEALIRARLPRLAELFYARSLRNRRRALDKLGLPR